MKELMLEHCTYDNGFPANIDKNSLIIVQVTLRPEQPVILYTSKFTGHQTRSYLDFSFCDKFKEKIYIFNKEYIQ